MLYLKKYHRKKMIFVLLRIKKEEERIGIRMDLRYFLRNKKIAEYFLWRFRYCLNASPCLIFDLRINNL